MRILGLALIGALLLAGCGGDGDSDQPSTAVTSTPADGDDAVPTPAGSAATSESGSTSAAPQAGDVTAALEAGSSAEVTAPDVGTVTMSIVEIISPADQILGAGLNVEPGFQLWAVEAAVEVADGDDEAICAFTVTTTTGNSYAFTGTASGNDLGFTLAQGSQKQGYVAFQLPEGEEVASLLAQFSVFAGYDIIFER